MSTTAGPAVLARPERAVILWLTNISHAVNHFQNLMVSVLYPLILTELGFGYTQLGVLTAVRGMLQNGTQIIYGFLVPATGHARLLGIGNLLLGFGTLLSGLAGSYLGFMGARSIAALGSSAQHPVGSSLLAKHYPDRRGSVLALNYSIANVGGFMAPLAAGLLLLALTWRQVFFLVALASLAVGVVYLLVRDRIAPAGSERPRIRFAQSAASYGRVLRNRNIVVISLVMMAGAAGRGEGVNVTFIAPHFVTDLGLSVTLAGLLLSAMYVGTVIGPLTFGWLYDRLPRKGVIQASLVFSGLASLWLANQGGDFIVLIMNMVIYGAVTGSRNPLTQALVADSLSDEDRDAGFSVYYFLGFISGPLWALLTGVLMDWHGFSTAFSILALTYALGTVLLFLVRDPRS